MASTFEQLAKAKLTSGTSNILLIAATFRSWQGSQNSIALGLACSAQGLAWVTPLTQKPLTTQSSQEGIQPCYSGLQVTGHR